LKRIWNKFDKIDERVDKIGETVYAIRDDVAYIKGKLEGEKIHNSNSTKLKATVIGSVIMGLSGIIVALIAFYKPS
jgi:hypothetical protein